MAPFRERLPPIPQNSAKILAMPLVLSSLSRSADCCRATSRLDTSSSMEMAVIHDTAPISAAFCAITPQSMSDRVMDERGHQSASLPKLGRNQTLRTSSGTAPTKSRPKERGRQRRRWAARGMDGPSAARRRSKARRRGRHRAGNISGRIKAHPARGRQSQIGLRNDLRTAGNH